MINTISFDADQTLWDQRGVMSDTYGLLLEKLETIRPGTASRLNVQAFLNARVQAAGEFTGKPDLENMRWRGIQIALEQVDVSDNALITDLNNFYREHRFDSVRLFPEVLSVLNDLNKDFRVCLLSNGADYPRNKGLKELLSVMVFANDHGFEKPDARLFEVLLTKAGIQPDELIHVGDSLNDDVLGARNAGAYSAWINRDGDTDGIGAEPSVTLTSLDGLREAIQELNERE